MDQCNCCNTCNAYAYPQMWNKFPPCENQNEQVEKNIINGCWLCNNQYYNLDNKALYERSMFSCNIIPPCNTKCIIDTDSFLRIGKKC